MFIIISDEQAYNPVHITSICVRSIGHTDQSGLYINVVGGFDVKVMDGGTDDLKALRDAMILHCHQLHCMSGGGIVCAPFDVRRAMSRIMAGGRNELNPEFFRAATEKTD